MKYDIIKEINCPYEKTIKLIGNKWSLLIIKEFHLANKPLRFNNLLRLLKSISSKTLSAKLKDLIKYKVIKKEIVSTLPIIALYSLTDKGIELIKVLDSMAEWSIKWHK